MKTNALKVWRQASTGFVAFSIATVAIAGSTGGTISFSGYVFEPPCATSVNKTTTQVSVNCARPSVFHVSFQSTANAAFMSSSQSTPEIINIARYRMGAQEQRSLSIPGNTLGGSASRLTTMVISYL